MSATDWGWTFSPHHQRCRLMIAGWVIPTDAVRAVGRFRPEGPIGFRAVEPWVKDAPIRATRAEAFADIEEALR